MVFVRISIPLSTRESLTIKLAHSMYFYSFPHTLTRVSPSKQMQETEMKERYKF